MKAGFAAGGKYILLRLPLPIRRKFGIEMHPMKKNILILTLVAVSLAGRAALPQPDLVAQIHFAGGNNVSGDKNYAAFTNEFSSAEARALRAQTADKLAKFFAAWFAENSGAQVAGGAAKLRPLLDDLQNAEWYLEARTVGGKAEAALAVKTSDAGAQVWQSGLKPFFPDATFERANGWLICGTGANAPKIAGKISALNGAWLALDLNWPALGKFFPSVKELDLPETKFTVTATATDLKVDGKFLFPGNISAPLEPWRVPTNTLRSPFVSFTAVRGFSAWLDAQPWAADYKISPMPNQLFTWVLPQIPFQVFAALPCADSLSALRQAQDRLQPLVAAARAKNEMPFPISMEPTNRQLNFIGLPGVAPSLEAVNSSAGQFLLAAGFPNTARSRSPLPPELFSRLAQKNLLFYHWEITAERMPPLLQMSQFALMASWHKQLGGDTASLKWLQKIGPALGYTRTEVFQTAADEMTFTRQSPGAFTAVELFALANWLEADNFPGCNLKMPPRKTRPNRQATPAPMPGR